MKIIFNQINFLVLFIFSTIIICNTYKVIEEDGAPIPNVQIYNSDVSFGTISDLDGLFNIDLDGCFDVYVEHIGYQKKVIHLCDIENEIILIKSPIATNEVRVIGDTGKAKLKNMF